VRVAVILAVALLWAGAGWGKPSPAAKKKAAPAKATAKTTVKKAPAARKKASAKSTSPHSSASRTAKSTVKSSKSRSGRKRTVARRAVQQQPTADRYKEIQQALADKGYFQGAVDGAWGPDSVDALKRFQKDQNLDTDGKIGALSLIALGLGPKRTAALAAQAVPKAADDTVVDPPPVALPEP
jgi:peptidoglycan hydrolase-like protein with peptidoglycan-binding domain